MGAESPRHAEPVPSAGVKSTERTLEVLEVLSKSRDGMTAAEVARSLGIPRSSTHGILRTMLTRGWLEIDESGARYRVGLKALQVGTSYVESDDIVALAQPALEMLSVTTEETAHLGRLVGGEIVYLAKRESTHALRLYSAVGRRLPAHATALGKVLLAQLDDDEVIRRLSWPLTKVTPKTMTDQDQLIADLNKVRDTGYAVDRGESTLGLECIAVAMATRGTSMNAISSSVPDARMTDDHRKVVLAAVQKAVLMVDQISYRLT